MYKLSLGFLKTDTKARYQGYLFYFREGFCWSDINTTFLKCRMKQKSINDVKSMSLYAMENSIPEYFAICLINSTFMSYYVDTFVNNTQTFQINDARQLPIVMPDKNTLSEFQKLFKLAVNLKKSKMDNADELLEIQEKLDDMVNKLYKIV